MKIVRIVFILIALIVIGATVGYYLSLRDAPETAEAVEPVEPEVMPEEPIPGDTAVVPTRESIEAHFGIQFPSNSLQDEMVVQFRSRSDYLAYLAALGQAGLAPIGQIDELLALRLGLDAIAAVDPSRYESQPSFTYRIQRPPAPIEVAPEALASLRAFGISARQIVGEVEGDGSGVLVGILDSGIHAHPQFDDVYIVHIDLAGGGVHGEGGAHGTAVASIIAGSEGIAPVAELFVVRVLDDEGLGNSYDVADGIVQATDMGVKIMNLSLGLYEDALLVREAVRYAHDRGVILVASAGNDGFDRMPYPAAYPDVLSVTAVDADGRHALFPNQSEEIDFSAPGVGVLSAKEDFGTELFSGTSAAAPFVTGTLASILSADPSRSSKEAVELLRLYLNDAGAEGPDERFGDGTVDWNRLRERRQAGLVDVALADIYLASDAQPGTTMPIEVTVQNRGTKWIPKTDLEIVVGEAEPQTFTIGSLGPGETSSRKVYTQVPSTDSTDTLDIAAIALPPEPTEDHRPENNIRAVTYRPR